MKLKDIYLYPDLVEFQSSSVLLLRDQTRFICNFVQHFLVGEGVETNGFNKICIVCKSIPSRECYINSSKALIVELQFDADEYCKIEEVNLPEYFIGLLRDGFTRCTKEYSLPIEKFNLAIESFRNNVYRNEWVHSEKNFKSAGLKCRLLCALTMTFFKLTLEVERAGMVIFSQDILRTIPDEIVYAHKFKDVNFSNDQLVVVDKFGNVIFKCPPI